jgi:hypothetical protein
MRGKTAWNQMEQAADTVEVFPYEGSALTCICQDQMHVGFD